MPFVPLAHLPETHLEWFWPAHLPSGHLVLFDGDPKVGKSLLTLDLCARITSARPFPDGAAPILAGHVIVVNAEDRARDTIRPRLAAAGADINKVTVWHRSPNEDWLRLPHHVDKLHEALVETHAKLVVLDPISAFVDPRVNLMNELAVRRMLLPLADLADKHRCVIALVRHLSKMAGRRALYRGLNSIGFLAAARLGLLIALDPKIPGRRVLAPYGTNFGALPPSLAYEIVSDAQGAARVEWRGPTPWFADDLTANVTARDRQRARARALIMGMLKAGPRPVREIYDAAKEADISAQTLRRARLAAKVKKTVVGSFHDHTTWWLLDGQELPRHLLSEDAIAVHESLKRAEAAWEAMGRDQTEGGETVVEGRGAA